MRLALAIAPAVAACVPHTHGSAIGQEAGPGMAIAVYDRADGTAYGVVDDRRWIDVRGGAIELDHIESGADLASLVIEPFGAAPRLRFTSCMRDRLPEAPEDSDDKGKPRDQFVPVVHCAVDGAPGRYLVRVLYVAATIAYPAHHDIAMTAADRATVITRYAIPTRAWGVRAEIALYDGAPGGEHPPREVARGQIALDGSIAIVAVPPREVPVRLRRIYDGAIVTADAPSTDESWGHESSQAVWVWLELPDLELAPGEVHVHLELASEGLREIDVPAASRERADHGPLRLPLWIDGALVGMRQRSPDFSGSALRVERLLLSVANTGDVPREVWIEEPMRAARRRRIERAWPERPIAAGERLRSTVTVKPGRIERVGYSVAYEQ